MLDPGSSGVKRNREVVHYWRKYVDELIYIPLLSEMKKAFVDEKFRKNV